MSGNGKSSIMRPASRSPPFVVVGLLVLMCALGYKYWSLLGQHGDLSAQWEKVQSELRVVYEKQIASEKKSTDLTGELSQEKQNVDNLKKTVEERDKKVGEQQQQIDQLNKEVTTNKESVAKCDKEKGDLQAEKEKLTQENTNLKKEVEKARATPCDRNACKEPIRELVGELNKIIGQPTVAQALSKVSFDLKPILGDMMESAGNQNPADGGKGQPQQQPQVLAQKANNIQMQLPAVGRVPQRGGLLEQGVGEPGGGDSLKMGSEEQLQGQRVQNGEMNFNQIEDRRVQVDHQDKGKPEVPQMGDLQMDVNEEVVEEENGKQEQLPEDEMDKQAAAIQAAQESAAARDGNMGDSNLKAHFQDLSQNGASNQEVNADYEVELPQQRMDDFNKQELKRWNAEGKKNGHLDGSDI